MFLLTPNIEHISLIFKHLVCFFNIFFVFEQICKKNVQYHTCPYRMDA